MPSSRHLRAVRSASVAAVMVMVTGAISLLARPEMAVLYVAIVSFGVLGWSVVRAGYPTLGAVLASVAGLFYPWYGLWTPEPSTTVVSEVGWLVLATCMAAVTLRPLLYMGFAGTNAGVMLGLASLQPTIEAPAQWALAGLLGLLFVCGTVVAWQRRRLADDVEQREADLRAAERHAQQRAAAAEAARDRLERAHTELMTRSRTVVVGELSTAIGHEINNPLTAIVMASEELSMRRPSDPEVRQALELIRDATEQCRSVVGRLLRNAVVAAPARTRIDFGAVAGDALELTRRHLEHHGAMIEVDIEGPIEIWGDVAELRQIVFNLLMHVAAREPGRVRVRGGTNSERGWLSIFDDGPPMPEAQRAAAFQPMLEGRPSPMIGLALCRTLVRRHDGQIALTSNAKGCTFTVALPLAGGTVAG